MDIFKFYLLSDRCDRNALSLRPAVEIDLNAVFHGDVVPSVPIRFRQNIGRVPCDLMGTGWAGVELLSKRVIGILESEGFVGWKTYPVEVKKNDETYVEGYEGFSVIGRCGPIDWSKGREEHRPPFGPGLPTRTVWVGMYFDPANWDGSDIFSPAGTTYTIVKESVKEAFEKHQVTNVMFTRLTEFERTWPL